METKLNVSSSSFTIILIIIYSSSESFIIGIIQIPFEHDWVSQVYRILQNLPVVTRKKLNLFTLQPIFKSASVSVLYRNQNLSLFIYKQLIPTEDCVQLSASSIIIVMIKQ